MDHVAVPDMSPEQLLTKLVEQYTDSLLRTCYVYLRDAHRAQDIVQEVFLRAWTHMNVLRRLEERAQKAWLVEVAVNLCRDHYRSRWFRHIDARVPVEDVQIDTESLGPEEGVLLMDVMNLPEKYRQIILLYYYQELTLREAAQILGVSHTVAQRRLKKAVDLLGADFAGRNEHEG